MSASGTENSIMGCKEEFMKLLQTTQVVLIAGDGGPKRSTEVPQWCLEYSKKGVCCTQPRRTRAISLAQIVSKEMGVELGKEVGFQIRFEDKTSPATVLKYVTDGMLLRQFMEDPKLEGYQVVILDEVQERSLNTDVLLGLMKSLVQQRKELKLVIMIGNGNVEEFEKYFENAAMLQIQGENIGEILAPAVLQEDLTSILLTLKKLGVEDLTNFWMTEPPPQALKSALERLTHLGALDKDGKLTNLGVIMAGFLLEPKVTKVLISSGEHCQDVLSVVAMMNVPNCFWPGEDGEKAKVKFAGEGNNHHLTLLNVYNAFKENGEDEKWCKDNCFNYWSLKVASGAREQLSNLVEKFGLKTYKDAGASNNSSLKKILSEL